MAPRATDGFTTPLSMYSIGAVTKGDMEMISVLENSICEIKYARSQGELVGLLALPESTLYVLYRRYT